MPIEVDSEIRIFDRDDFHSLSHRVLGIAFDVHNEFGRLLDESIYKRAIMLRCAAAGILPVRQEVQITVRFEGFEKRYFMDLLCTIGLMVEAKTVESLTKAHFAQALQYLMLTGMPNGLLVNLRPERVEHQFVSTTLDLAERRRFTIHEADWQPINEPSRWLRETVARLLADWGRVSASGPVSRGHHSLSGRSRSRPAKDSPLGWRPIARIRRSLSAVR